MVNPAWGLLFIAGYCLLQVPLVLYLARYLERDGPLPPVEGYATDFRPAREADAEDGGGAPAGMRVCGRCGAENAAEYTFCRDCADRLSPSP